MATPLACSILELYSFGIIDETIKMNRVEIYLQ